MESHEMLKEICDKIGYNPVWYWTYIDISSWVSEPWYYRDGWNDEYYPDVDVREIIFTPEFRRKFAKWMWGMADEYGRNIEEYNNVTDHLDNPVQYLYDTLWLWTK